MARHDDRDTRSDLASDRVGTAVEIVFCSTARNIVELDCRTVGGARPGWPFFMRLGLPGQAPWSAAAERMLIRWAGEGAIVTVDLRAGRRPAKVRLSHGDAAVVLDAMAPGAVFR